MRRSPLRGGEPPQGGGRGGAEGTERAGSGGARDARGRCVNQPISGGAAAGGAGPAAAGRWRRAAAAAPGRERGPAEAPEPAGAARAGTRRPRFGAGGCGSWRGLNPPHRVKSISMTTFSEAEVLFLQAHGNEACRRIWLGTFDPRTSLLPDSCDPQKVKEFLQEKYEKKRWYVPPEQVKEEVKEQVKPPQSTTAEPGPPQLLHGDTGTLPQPRPAARKASTDLLADIGGDPFASPAPAPAFAAFPAPARSAFPSFDAFGSSPGAPTFGGAVPPFHVPPSTTGYTNPFMAPVAPRPSTNPFEINGPGTAFTSPPVPGGFPSPFQADGLPFSGFSVAKASTNPFVTVPAPAAPFGIRHRATNPFL